MPRLKELAEISEKSAKSARALAAITEHLREVEKYAGADAIAKIKNLIEFLSAEEEKAAAAASASAGAVGAPSVVQVAK